MRVPSLLAVLLAPLAACSGGDGGSGPADAAPRDGSSVDATRTADAAPLTCFDFSLDPKLPLALDGTFDADSPTWRRPHDEGDACPASGLLPDTAARVPYVAYAFCNTDSAAHTFDFELLGQPGLADEPALDDPYLILYDGVGIPGDPLACRAANDDIPEALDAKDSEILGIEVAAGGAITMVLTTFTFDPDDGTGTGYYIGVVTNAD